MMTTDLGAGKGCIFLSRSCMKSKKSGPLNEPSTMVHSMMPFHCDGWRMLCLDGVSVCALINCWESVISHCIAFYIHTTGTLVGHLSSLYCTLLYLLQPLFDTDSNINNYYILFHEQKTVCNTHGDLQEPKLCCAYRSSNHMHFFGTWTNFPFGKILGGYRKRYS